MLLQEALFRWGRAAVLLVLAVCLLPFGTRAEAAARHTLNYFQTAEVTVNGRNALRIEIGMTGSSDLDYAVTEYEGVRRQLAVTVQKTQIGEIEPDIPLPEKYASRMRIKDRGSDTLQFVMDLSQPVSGSYAIHEEKAERRSHKPHRLVIDIFEPVVRAPQAEGAKGHTIVLDPGHGGSDSGAVGPSGVTEASVTLAVSEKVKNLLEASGANVIMTRDADVDVCGPNASADAELQARVNVGAAAPGAEIFISIHCNAFSSSSAHGTEAYYYTYGGTAAAHLATVLNEEIVAATGLSNRGVKTANFYVMKHAPMPASLVELAFVTNDREESLLADDTFQETLAKAIARAIGRYFTEGE